LKQTLPRFSPMCVKISENIIEVRHDGIPKRLHSLWSLEDYSEMKQGYKSAARLCIILL